MMKYWDLTILTYIALSAVYIYRNRPIHQGHFMLCGWAVVNVVAIKLGTRTVASLPDSVLILADLLSVCILGIIAVPTFRYYRATRNQSLFDSWDPGVPQSLIYLSAVFTTPPAYYLALVSKKPILWPDIPAPYVYFAMAGFVVLAIIAFLPVSLKQKLGARTPHR